jgi:hypothetical protein
VVNGREVIRDNAYLGVPAGQIIRPGQGTYTVKIPGVSADERLAALSEPGLQ